MADRTVSIAEAKAHLSELVLAAEAGEDVVITKRGKPVASLVGRERTKQQVDLDWLRQRTRGMPLQEEDSGTFMRRVRDTDRY
jgi:prevent-host-death family protein